MTLKGEEKSSVWDWMRLQLLQEARSRRMIMTALFWKDKPVGDMEGRWIVRGEGGNRELVQRLLPGKGDEG